ncbi:hypothetical protein HD597_012163 [Nonomuraea thailandensis]|uniref:Uncharacterized protein n=1 Tax=Nonomuraea thailandensis TaxID=1188745 RepID=A0A9X2H383_9ACTN|nr:hypothetical protein [Nonomuraea thailandensis]MCP2365143.1 hypothetical protein [Nonomuraea thailandensis]
MLHVLLVRCTAPPGEVTPHVPGHVAYLERRARALLTRSGR